jgi:AcrR family transcriptional regulator
MELTDRSVIQSDMSSSAGTPISAKTPLSRRRRQPEVRSADILNAALDAFVENGFAATRLEDIAERAGVSKGTLYLYFESKEALFKAVIRETIVPVVERAEQRVEAFSGSSRELLALTLRSSWSALSESRMTGLPKLVLAEATNFPEVARAYFDEVVLRVRGLFARVLRRGIDRGEFRPLDVEYTARAMIAPVVMAQIWKHSLVKCQIDAIDFDRQLDVLIDLILNGVASSEERAPEKRGIA